MKQTRLYYTSALKFAWGILLFYAPAFSQETGKALTNTYDPGFHEYLNGVRIACLDKDTLQLHKLLGDAAFGMSCYGLEGIDRNYTGDWETFKAHFKLMEQPAQSGFWDLFLRLSNNGFYHDTYFNTYEVPASHHWGLLNAYPPDGKPLYTLPMLQKTFYTNTVTIRVGNEPQTGNPVLFVPQKRGTGKYPYEFQPAGDEFYLCLENGQKLGFVSAKDIIQWNLHFSFRKNDTRWFLDLYETCTDFDW